MQILSGHTPDPTSRGRIATVGMFDGVHLGHRHLLRSLIDAGDRLGLSPMAITFTRHPLHVIAPHQPLPLSVSTLPERLVQLESTGVGECLLLDFDTRLMHMSARDFLRMLRDEFGVRAFLTGFNNRFGCDTSLTFDDYTRIAREENIELLCATRFTDGISDTLISSSAIRTLIGTHGDVAGAAAMLGRPFSLTGTVIHGKAIGRTIGYPTANLRPIDDRCLIPLNGVYACQALLPGNEGLVLPAMVNIGNRPTFNDSRGRSIEAHVIGLDRDIYGATVTLRFLQRLREERKFDSPQALRDQLAADCDITLHINRK